MVYAPLYTLGVVYAPLYTPGCVGILPGIPPGCVSIPPGIHPGICTPVYTPGICTLYTPGYTRPATVLGDTAATVAGLTRLTALTRAIAELTISDGRVSVLPRVPPFPRVIPVSLLG